MSFITDSVSLLRKKMNIDSGKQDYVCLDSEHIPAVQDQVSGCRGPSAAQPPGAELTGNGSRALRRCGEEVGFLLTRKRSAGKPASVSLHALVRFQLHCPGALRQAASLTKLVQNEHGRAGFEALLGAALRKKFQLCFFTSF